MFHVAQTCKTMVASAILASAVFSTSAFAAIDLVAPSYKTDLFRSSTPISAFLVSEGTDKYVLKHLNGTKALDEDINWYGNFMPARVTSPMNGISYVINSGYAGIKETGVSGNPQCVAFVKSMTNTYVSTGLWIRGTKLTDITSGSTSVVNKAIATFNSSGKYDNQHTAIILSTEFSSAGKLTAVWVADQNFANPADGRIRKHKIGTSGTVGGVNHIGSYYIVQS